MTDGFSIEAFTGICSYDSINECMCSYAIGDNRMFVAIDFQTCIDIKWNLKLANPGIIVKTELEHLITFQWHIIPIDFFLKPNDSGKSLLAKSGGKL